MKEETIKRWIKLGKDLSKTFNDIRVKEGDSLKNIETQVFSINPKHSYGCLEVGFPGNCCVGRKEIICHGIPDQRRVRSQDLVKVDIVLGKSGLYVDSCWTYLIGLKYRNFWMRSYLAFCMAVKILSKWRDSSSFKSKSKKIFKNLGLGVVKEFTGHGIGSNMHQDPVVDFDESFSFKLKNNLALTIEPIFYDDRASKKYSVKLKNSWEYYDESRSFIMFEHTLLFLHNKTLILTFNSFDELFKILQPEYFKIGS